ncbi:tetratricopeptide repeat protein [Rariglobus hedericola]|uniref:Sel1 repeat family protein n=1 Tax=Rariglobus hedericola TaxID=2597822 RepID=A0A556QLI0_9BACT|nr:SEL1-like repeat protein [Rariglobus hedericola]TSJ77510.1 sel1 repeat family protein [Rariglobus hedericola]
MTFTRPRPSSLTATCGLLSLSALLLAATARAENPYNYRYGTMAHENARASNAYNDRINAPVTNRAGYTPDFSSTINQIRQTMGTKAPFDSRTGSERYQDEQRAAEARMWAKASEEIAKLPRPSAPPKPALLTTLRAEANDGNVETMHRLGTILFYAFDGTDTKAEGLAWFKRAAARGDAKATNELLSIYLGKSAYADFPAAVQIFTDKARAGDDHCTRQLADAYLTGIPGKLEANPQKAVEFLELGAARGEGYCGITLGRAYRDGQLLPKNVAQDSAKAIATYRQLIEVQRAHPELKSYNYYTGSAGWEWFQLELAARPDLAGIPADTLSLWEFAATRGELSTVASTHRLAAALGALYDEGKVVPRDADKALLFHSISVSGFTEGSKTDPEWNAVIFDDVRQSRVLALVADRLLARPQPWPPISMLGTIAPATKANVSDLYGAAVNFAKRSKVPFPHPSLMLYRLSADPAYKLTSDTTKWIPFLAESLELGEVPAEPATADSADYAALLYEHAVLVRAESYEGIQKSIAAFQVSWARGYTPAALPLAELTDDGYLPGGRDAAKQLARAGAEKGDPYCAAQLGSWLTGELVAQPKPDPALVAESRRWLRQAFKANIERVTEDLADNYAANGDYRQAALNYRVGLRQAPSPRLQAGYAELLAAGKGDEKPDPKKAFELLKTAATEDPRYLVRLAQVIERAEWGATKDMNEVRELLERALYGASEWKAGIELARIYHTGVDGEKNEDRAANMLRAAGERGGAEAALAVAAAYEKGDIIDKDPTQVAYWKKVAIEGINLDPG